MNIKDHKLSRLGYYLNYEISSTALFFLSFVVPALIYLAILAAIIFTPYMLYVLLKEKKCGWVIAFVIMVILPLIFGLLLTAKSMYGQLILMLIIVLFYLYCFMLKYSVNDWIEAIKVKEQYLMEKKIRDIELNNFMEQMKD